MSFQAMAWAYSQTPPDAECKLILLALANYAGHDNSCWPSIPRLAKECLLSERTIQRRVLDLAAAKLIWIGKRITEKGDSDSNQYTLLMPKEEKEGGVQQSPGGCQSVTTGGVQQSPKPIIKEPIIEPTHSPQPPINCGRKSAVSYAAIQFALEKFWAAYPRKQNKVDVERAFVEVHAEDNLGDIMKALEWQCRSDDWNRDGGRFIPTPANYLRDHRWLDQNTDVRALRKKEKSALTLEIERFCARPLPE